MLRPKPRWGAYSTSPDLLAVFNGPTSKGREWKEEGKARGRERESRGGEGCPLQLGSLDPPVCGGVSLPTTSVPSTNCPAPNSILAAILWYSQVDDGAGPSSVRPSAWSGAARRGAGHGLSVAEHASGTTG